LFGLEASVRVDRARSLVVEKHHARAKENAILHGDASEHLSTVLEFAAIADANIEIYEDPLS